MSEHVQKIADALVYTCWHCGAVMTFRTMPAGERIGVVVECVPCLAKGQPDIPKLSPGGLPRNG